MSRLPGPKRTCNTCPNPNRIFRPTSFSALIYLFFMSSYDPPLVEGSRGHYAIFIRGLEQLADIDLSLAQNLSSYQEDEGNSTNSAFEARRKRYLKDFEGGTGISVETVGNMTSVEMSNHSSKIADNPLSAYRLIWRTSKLLKQLLNDTPDNFVVSSKLLDEDFIWPAEIDLTEAMDGIISLFTYYSLNVGMLAKGVLRNFSTGVKLDAIHCFELGVRTRKLKFLAQSVEWLELALEKTVRLNDSTVDPKRIRKQLKKSITKHDQSYLLRLGEEENPLFFKQYADPLNTGDGDSYTGFCKGPKSCIRPRRTKQGLNDRVDKLGGRDEDRYESYIIGICNGKNYQTSREKARLFCWREFRIHPKFTIGPMNMEFLSRSPDIVQMYDFVTSSTVSKVMNESLHYYRAAFVNHNEGKDSDELNILSSFYRIGMACSDHTRNTSLGRKIMQDIEDVVGLEVTKPTASNDLHLVSYAFTGHYNPHIDVMTIEEAENNVDFYRVATFMIYLADVEAGGYTTFPALGVGARPATNSALLWYNMLGNGRTVDDSLVHSACPPLMGRKLVMTSWITYYDQFQNLPCPKDKNAPIRFKVNGEMLPT